MKKRVFSVIALTASFVCCLGAGCGKNGVTGETGEYASSLVVYCVQDHPYYKAAVNQFKSIYNSVYEVELLEFESDEVMNEKLTGELLSGNGPDVILMDAGSGFDIFKTVQSGKLEDLKPYMESDEQFKEEDYYSAILRGGEWDGKQYVMPFSFSLDLLLTDTDTWKSVSDEKEMYTVQELFDSMNRNLERGNIEKMPCMLYANGLYRTQVEHFTEYSGIPVINEEQTQAVFPEEKAEMIYRFLMDINRVMKQWKTSLGEINSLAQLYEVSDMVEASGNCFVNARIWESLLGQIYQKMPVILPWSNEDGKPQPVIHDFGFLNADSKQKEAGYQFLLFLAKYDIPSGGSNGISVNKEVAQADLQSMNQNAGKTLEYKDGETINIAPLSDELKAKIETILENMATAVMGNTGYYEIVSSRMTEGLQTGEEFSAVYEDVLKQLNRYLAE